MIRNFKALARSKARRYALRIIDAGMEAVLIRNAMRIALSRKGNLLFVQGMAYNLSSFQNVYVVGFGKATIAICEELERLLGSRLTKGIGLDVSARKLKKISIKKCTHPVLSAGNVRNTKLLVDLLNKATPKDLILCAVSGGGSAILEHPAIPLDKYVAVNKALLRCGAEIHEMNAVRKHLSLVKGGQLPLYANGATFVSLIFSDVVGDDTSFIASGPTVPDKTKAKDAERIIKKYHLPHVHLHETPSDHPRTVHNFLILNNKVATDAMAAQARKLGLRPVVLSNKESGEARNVGEMLAGKARKGVALIAAGETTVTVKGHGRGGRNQEVVMGALHAIGDAVVASAGTDGIDNTPAAGGIVDKSTLKKAPSFQKYLDNNDAFNYLRKTKDLIFTGKTETNVADIMVVVKM